MPPAITLAPASRDSAVAWTRSTAPRSPTLIRFRWRYRDDRVAHAGRGSARIAPPDSLRFDYAGPLGLGSGAAVVIGDSVAWADPDKHFRSLVPAIPMLWAALGVVQPPAPGAVVFGAVDSTRVIWRFARGEDTLNYVARDSEADDGGRWLEAEWRRPGETIALGRAHLDAAGRPTSARIDFPRGPARFELTVVALDTAAVFPPALWRSRR